jgi:hypothetical protein
MTLNDRPPSDHHERSVGRAARLVIEQLAANGFGVQTREWEELWNLTVVGVEQARACLTVAEDGYLRWDYQPHTGPQSSPADIAAIVLHVFGADARDLSAGAYRNFLLKGAVGRRHPAGHPRLGRVSRSICG